VLDPALGMQHNGISAVGEMWHQSRRSGLAPRFHNWNINIQRELPGGLLLDAAYVGMRGSRLPSNLNDFNQSDPKYLALGPLLARPITDPAVVAAGYGPPYPGFRGTLAQALRPFPHVLGVRNDFNADARSWYDALQVMVERRYGALLIMAGYTWSKSLSEGSYSNTAFNEAVQDTYNDKNEKSLLRYDIPHSLKMVWSYDLPLGRGKPLLSGLNPVLDRVVSGWTIAAGQQYYSGNLLFLDAPVNTLGPGAIFAATKRLHVTGAPFRTSAARRDLDPNNPAAKGLNRDAVAIPGTYEFGNSARFQNQYRNPMILVENLGIIKRTTIRESMNLETRVEMSNVFNRTCFGNLQTNVLSPNYGRPIGPMLAPRLIQLVAKFNF